MLARRYSRYSGHTCEEVTDECRRREHWTRSELAYHHRIEQLRLGQPVQPRDQIVVQEREQHVPAPEHYGADLQEQEEQRPKRDRVQARAARMVLDTEFTPERMSQEIRALMTNRPRLEAMARAATALGRPDATGAVVRECLACLPSADRLDSEVLCR